MALFETPGPGTLHALLRVGFTARLRSELADIFVSHNADGSLTRTDARRQASVFYFVSAAANPAQADPFAPVLVAVLSPRPDAAAATEDPACWRYMSLMPGQPTLTEKPALMRVAVAPHAASPSRTLVSLARPGPGPTWVSMRGVARDGATLHAQSDMSKHALFHLEVLPCSVGAAPRATPPDDAEAFLAPAQAATHALLQLGVRLRLRSAHGLLLCARAGGSGAAASDEAVVLRADANAEPLVLTGFMCARDDSHAAHHDPAAAAYALVRADAPSSLAIDAAQAAAGHVARLVAAATPPIMLTRATRAHWGALQLAAPSMAAASAAKPVPPARLHWLMAGPRGRLETRAHARAWETFRVEFVVQSLAAALRELPVFEPFLAAERVTRTALREQITARIAVAPAPARAAAAGGADADRDARARGKTKTKAGGFDHSRALAALAGEPVVAAGRATTVAGGGDTRKKVTTGAAGPKVDGAKRPAASGQAKHVAGAAATTLPRHLANKKSAKKAKKKGKAARAAAKAATHGSGAAAGAASRPPTEARAAEAGPDVEKSVSGSGKQKAGPEKEEAIAASTSSSPAASGPPCAACGRTLQGPYTTAMGRKFHAHCFCCGRCRRPMSGGGSFRERNGVPYCTACYSNYLAARCARCSKAIMETVVTAMDKTWHRECLTCVLCRLPLTETFWLYADRPKEPRCSRCVTGEEHSRRSGSRGRLVNLPGFSGDSGAAAGSFGSAPGLPSQPGGSGQSGRVMLRPPAMPPLGR